ncbi:MAG: CBS domain-containing protein [Gammaproteobacteria bacterium]|nr:CBS domain-containing protein [Gammaproteobacteria bacterium]
MSTVAEILKNKGTDVWSVSPEQSVYDAIKMMDDKGAGALAVVSQGRLAGIISERDYARKVILKGRSSKETRVKDIMTSHVYHTIPDDDVSSCMLVMGKHHIRHMPVLDGESLVGMISISDVVKVIIQEQEDRIKQLEHTVTWQESY